MNSLLQKPCSADAANGQGASERLSLFQLAIDAVSDSIAILDERARIIAVNTAWRRFADTQRLNQPGYGVGLNYLEVCDSARGDYSEQAPAVAAAIRGLLSEKRGDFRCEYPCHDPSARRWFQLRASCFEQDSRLYLVLQHQDITEVKLVQKALQAAQVKLHRHSRTLEERVAQRTAELESSLRTVEAFSHSVAHDLRAPLRAIRDFVDLLLLRYASDLDPEARHILQQIRASAERLDLLTRDLLALGRVTAAQFPLRTVDVEQVAGEVVGRLLRLESHPAGCIDVARPLPLVRGNATLLEQALVNLLSNALKFVAPGVAPSVRIRAEEHDGKVRLYVEDNGIGIPAHLQRRLFQPFQQLHAHAYPGTGVGLTIVQKAAERMGGRAGVESEPGKGSRFWIELLKPQA